MTCLRCSAHIGFKRPRGRGMEWAATRGLCHGCYSYCRDHDLIDDYPRRNRPQADVIEDWLELQAQGYTRRLAAARLGMTFAALDQAITRYHRTFREAS